MPSLAIGQPLVLTSRDGGHSPEQLTELAINRLVYVGQHASPKAREQAMAVKGRMREVLTDYFYRAQAAERRTICALLDKQGHKDMADIIRRL
jgi:hypothetical protein